MKAYLHLRMSRQIPLEHGGHAEAVPPLLGMCRVYDSLEALLEIHGEDADWLPIEIGEGND